MRSLSSQTAHIVAVVPMLPFGEDLTLENDRPAVVRPLEGKKGYIHVIQTSGYNEGQAKGAQVRVSSKGGEELTLREGDGAYIYTGKSGDSLVVENDGTSTAEILVFDLD